MIDRETRNAQREYDAELDVETARIIRELGVPAWEAISQAQANIKRRGRQLPLQPSRSFEVADESV